MAPTTRCLTPAADKAVRKSLKSSLDIVVGEAAVGALAEAAQGFHAFPGGQQGVVGASLRELTCVGPTTDKDSPWSPGILEHPGERTIAPRIGASV